MIKTIRHKGLKRLYEEDDSRGLNAQHIDKIARILSRLDRSAQPEDMAVPGMRLHPLKGNLAGYWSVTIQANWRIIFRFDGGHITDVDLIDYH